MPRNKTLAEMPGPRAHTAAAWLTLALAALVTAPEARCEQSSHLGDEYLLQNPDATRVDEGIVAYAIAGRGRAYLGGGLLLRRHPAMERGKLLAGVEWRGRSHSRSLVQQRFMSALVAGAELKLLAADDWNPNLRAILGVEFLRPRGTGGVRVLAEYYHGSFPYGQFFHEKVDQLGLGIHLGL